MNTLLVHGYIREVEKLLASIIPFDIFHICFDFYFATKFIFYLGASDTNNIMCTANIDTKKGWKISIHELEIQKK